MTTTAPVMPVPADALLVTMLTAAVAITSLSGLVFGAVFSGTGHIAPVLGAAALPAAIVGGLAGLGGWCEPSRILALPARAARAAAALAALGLYVALVVAPGTAVLDGPARLLTAAVPLDPRGPELAAVVIAVGLASLCGGELALRPRAAAITALPGLLLFLAGLAVGASGVRLSPWVPAGILAGVGILVAASSMRPGGVAQPSNGPQLAGAATPKAPPPALRAATGLAMVLAAAAAALTIGPTLPGATLRAERFDARDLIAEPVTPKSEVSPLVTFPALLTEAERPLFTVRTDAPVSRFGIATLTDFNGQFWTTAGTYRRAGKTLPPGPDLDAPGSDLNVTVTLDDQADLGWLPRPSPGRAATVSVGGLGVDADTGDLVVPADRTTPASYDLTVRVPSMSESGIAEAVRAEDTSDPPAYDLPADIHAATQRAAASADTAFGQLAALQRFFRESGRFRYDVGSEAPSGHGLYQISRVLADHHGTAEQFASAFAVMARDLGFDARVVIGFRPPTAADSTGTYAVTSRDIHVWPEIRFDGLGWIPFEPSPLDKRSQTTGGQPAPADSIVDRAVAAESNRGTPARPDNPPRVSRSCHRRPARRSGRSSPGRCRCSRSRPSASQPPWYHWSSAYAAPSDDAGPILRAGSSAHGRRRWTASPNTA